MSRVARRISAVLSCCAASMLPHSAVAADVDPPVLRPPSNALQGAERESALSPEANISRSDIVPPRLLHFEPADYPGQAEQQGIEAVVVLQIEVDVEGHVLEVQVRGSAGHGFDEAAVAAAKRFIFEPATKAGLPVGAKILYRYGFKLEPRPVPADEANRAVVVRTGGLRGCIVAGTPAVAVAGAAVRLRSVGLPPITLSTAADGTWAAQNLTPGDYDVEVVASGFLSTRMVERVESGRVTAIRYTLESTSDGTIEVTVRGAAMHREVTHYELSRTELVRVPGTFGDAIHAVEAMPSVARPPAFSGALIVRGSAPQDTQLFVEGTLVPRVFHFGSLSSVVPSEMIEKLEFYPSNFSVRYGRGMGGVVEVGLRLTNPDNQYHGSAQVDFINARANVEGPVPLLRGWNFMAGYRTSYVDRWLVPVLRSSGSAIQGMPRYYDYQLYLERRLPGKGVFRVGFFGAQDIYVPIEANPRDWRAPSDAFGHLQSQLRLPLSPMLDFKASWSLGRMHSSSPGEDNRMSQTTANLGTLRAELAVKTGTFGIARIGTDVLYAPFTVKALTDQPNANGELASARTDAPRLENFDIHGVYLRPATFAEYELAPSRRVNITTGMRLDYTKDTAKYDVAPRAAARFVAVNKPISTVLKGGWGLFYQPPDPAQTLPGLGYPGLSSSRAIHSMLGFEQSLSKQVTISVEGFEKEMQRVVSARVDGSGNVSVENSGRGRVFGIDVLLRYHPDERFFGWMAYTLSRSTRQAAPDMPTRLFSFDQTHVLNLLASYRLGRGWELGGRFRYMSGFLYSSCLGGMFDNSTGNYRCYGPVTQRRLAPFHQLDLRVEKTWEFTGFRCSAYLDLINAYYYASPDYAIPNYDLSGVKPLSLSLPILPSIGLRGEL